MAFKPRTWVNRHVQFPLRREYTLISDNIYDVKRAEGNITAEGDKFNAENMNDLEQRIDTAFKDANAEIDKKTSKTYVDTALEKKTDKTYVDTELDKKADTTYVNDNFSNALKGKEFGSVISADDVSPIVHNVKCKAESKNLCENLWELGLISDRNGAPIPSSAIFRSVTFNHISSNQNYTVSCSNSYSLRHIYFYNKNKEYLDSIWTGRQNPYNFIAPSGAQYFKVCLEQRPFTSEALTEQDVITANKNAEYQIERGSVATPYTPYIDVSNTNVNVFGKNLLEPNPFGSAFDLQGDGSYKSKITIVPNFSKALNVPIDVYTFSYDIKSPQGCNYRLKIEYTDGSHTLKNVNSDGNYNHLTLTSESKKIEKIYWHASKVSNDVSFKNFQMEYGSVPTDYEPYINNGTYTPTADGTVNGIKSIAPNMTITSDTDGVNIEAEYNRDINKAFEKLTNTIISLGGNI